MRDSCLVDCTPTNTHTHTRTCMHTLMHSDERATLRGYSALYAVFSYRDPVSLARFLVLGAHERQVPLASPVSYYICMSCRYIYACRRQARARFASDPSLS